MPSASEPLPPGVGDGPDTNPYVPVPAPGSNPHWPAGLPGATEPEPTMTVVVVALAGAAARPTAPAPSIPAVSTRHVSLRTGRRCMFPRLTQLGAGRQT